MTLYKYLKKERTEPIRDFTLRITQPSLLNDPWECSPSMTAPSIFGLPPEVANPDDINNLSAGKKLQDEWSKRIGILCLSESACSTLMWSHYASDHEGYVLGFDSELETFNPADEAVAGLGRMTKVTYSEKRFRLGVTGGDSDFKDLSYLFQKSHDWSYENEWRLVVPLMSGIQTSDSIFAWGFPPEALREVVIGFRTAPDLRDELIGLRAQFPWIRIHFARPSATTNQMVLEANPTSAKRDDRMKTPTISKIGWSVFGLLLVGQLLLKKKMPGIQCLHSLPFCPKKDARHTVLAFAPILTIIPGHEHRETL